MEMNETWVKSKKEYSNCDFLSEKELFLLI